MLSQKSFTASSVSTHFEKGREKKLNIECVYNSLRIINFAKKSKSSAMSKENGNEWT